LGKICWWRYANVDFPEEDVSESPMNVVFMIHMNGHVDITFV
jgi:hypothetical protein